ncbi:MAG TPA: murein L,D-transpeptidase, partial [Roseiflexaceae bacterium]
SEEFVENGVTVQYFERARFEYHPGAQPRRYDVLLGWLGSELTAGRRAAGEAPFQDAQPKQGCAYVAETRHNLCGAFRSYWQAFGDLPLYGHPISEEFVENGVTVQYFERARFEYHPGAQPRRYDVLLGWLGSESIAARGPR